MLAPREVTSANRPRREDEKPSSRATATSRTTFPGPAQPKRRHVAQVACRWTTT